MTSLGARVSGSKVTNDIKDAHGSHFRGELGMEFFGQRSRCPQIHAISCANTFTELQLVCAVLIELREDLKLRCGERAKAHREKGQTHRQLQPQSLMWDRQ